MSHLRYHLVVAAILGLCTVGCVVVDGGGSPESHVTCGHFDEFQYNCTADCSPRWSCEANYESLGLQDQTALDACSDCLVDNLRDGVCADCALPREGVYSCQDFMEDLLGVSCW